MTSIFNIAMFLKAIDNASAVFRKLSNNAVTELGKIQTKMRDISQSMREFGQTSLLTGGAITGAVGLTIKTFADLEEAQIRLKTLSMDASGRVGKDFQAMLDLADKLGTELPGSTKDMVEMFIALREQGIQTKYILGGVGEAAAKLATLMKIPFAEGATFAAKLQEAMGVADNQMVQFMDTIQRLKGAAGIEMNDLLYSFKYMGASLKALNVQGVESGKELATVLGMLAANANEGSTAGTNMAMALTRMAELSHRMDRAAIRKLVAPILDPKGIKLSFFTEAGEFIGIKGMVKELEKLRALNPQETLLVLQKLFGMEAARPLSILVEKGIAGYDEMLQRMQKQADMQKKIDEIMSGTKMQWDTLSGTFKNVIAHTGGAIVGALHLGFIFKTLNEIFGKIDNWVMNHQRLAGAIGAVVAIGGGALVVLGGLALALGAIFNMSSYAVGGIKNFIKFIQWGIPWIKMKRMEILRLIGVQKAMDYVTYHGGFWKAMQFFLLTTKYRLLETVAAMRAWIATQLIAARSSFLSISGLRSMASAFGSTLLTVLKAAIMGVRAFSLALVTTPIGWIALAIAAAAFLIYKFWKPISGFFKGLWAGIKEGLKGIEPAWNVFKKIAPLLFPIIWPLKVIYNLIKWLIKPVEDTGKAAENLGFRIGKVIGNIMKTFVTLPYKMFELGASLINSLWKGIMSLANKPIEAIKNIGKATIQAFKGLLGIASPSKVFADFGSQIAQGVNLGMVAGGGRVAAASRFMTQPILQPIKSAPAFRAVGGGDITLHFHFTLPKGTDSETAQRIIKTSGMEIERVMRRKYAI